MIQNEDSPNIFTRYDEQLAPNVFKDDAPMKRRFYALQTRGEKPDEGDDDDGKLLYFLCDMSSFLVGEYGL